jgi:hypothetical protein
VQDITGAHHGGAPGRPRQRRVLAPDHVRGTPPPQEIIDEAQFDHYPSWVPNFASVAAAPSIYPKRNFCTISGLMGKYKCPVTGDYVATLPAYETHRETRLKGLI